MGEEKKIFFFVRKRPSHGELESHVRFLVLKMRGGVGEGVREGGNGWSVGPEKSHKTKLYERPFFFFYIISSKMVSLMNFAAAFSAEKKELES